MIGTTFLQNSILTELIQIVSPTDPLWQECLDSLAYDFYHLPGYLELEAARHFATPEAIIIKDGDQVFFLPYLIRDCRQLPDSSKFRQEEIYDVISPYGYPGLLVNQAGQNPRFIKKCLNLTYDRWQAQNICSAFMRLHPILNSYIDSSISTRDKFVVCPQGDVVVCDLSSDIDEIWKQIRRTHRNKINKLTSAGFTAKMVSIEQYLDVFIDIYLETMNRVNATDAYYFTRDYFQGLVDILGDRLNMCVVETAGTVVAACLLTEFNGIIQYHLGGTRTEFLPQSPATIMVYSIIEWAKQRNNNYVNLGGGIGGNQDSLYQFKSGFSSQSKPFVTIKTIVDNDIYDHLTSLRAESLGKTLPELKDESFFPVYRFN
jgi:Acetyltransferase (GNAT) domain